jgi:hypothetical protein
LKGGRSEKERTNRKNEYGKLKPGYWSEGAAGFPNPYNDKKNSLYLITKSQSKLIEIAGYYMILSVDNPFDF